MVGYVLPLTAFDTVDVLLLTAFDTVDRSTLMLHWRVHGAAPSDESLLTTHVSIGLFDFRLQRSQPVQKASP